MSASRASCSDLAMTVGSDRLGLLRQCLGRPAASDGHVDVLAGEGVGEGWPILPESYDWRSYSTELILIHGLRGRRVIRSAVAPA